MFDVGAGELLVILVVAILVIGPKDMPLAMRSAGRWIGKMRRMSNHFRAGVDAMIREAEMEDAEKEWRERNARIMAEHPDAEALDQSQSFEMEPSDSPPQDGPVSVSAEAALRPAAGADSSEPELPLGGARKGD